MNNTAPYIFLATITSLLMRKEVDDMGELIGAILVVLFIFGTGLIIDLVEYIIKDDEYDEEHVILTRKDKHKHRRTETFIKD